MNRQLIIRVTGRLLLALNDTYVRFTGGPSGVSLHRLVDWLLVTLCITRAFSVCTMIQLHSMLRYDAMNTTRSKTGDLR